MIAWASVPLTFSVGVRTDYQRPINERILNNFFSDPSLASIGCAKTGEVKVSKDVFKGKEGEEVFEQARSLLFKSLRVRRCTLDRDRFFRAMYSPIAS